MNSVTSGHAAALWVGLHLVLLLVLSMAVVRQRRKHKVALGDGGIAELARVSRAFANATEYVPAGLIAITVLAVLETAPLAIHVIGFLLLAGRVIHAFGLSNSGAASIPRALGILLTWIAYVFAAVALLFYAIA